MPINVYPDMSNAFDTLDHQIVWHKLDHYGIRYTCSNLLKRYLCEQFVKNDGIKYISI